MAGSLAKSSLKGAWFALSGLVTFSFWTVWLVLALILGLQIYIASTNQLQVPGFVQKAILDKLAISGLHISFGNTIFDPSGSILIENATVTLDGFDEPIATVQSLYARIDAAALAFKRVEPLELRVSGVTLRVPAMLSPSGKADEIIKDLDADFIPKDKSLKIEYLRGHVGSLLLSVSGEVPFGDKTNVKQDTLPLADLLARNYPSLSKRCATALGLLGSLDKPYLRVSLIPTPNGEIADCTLGASELRLGDPILMQMDEINTSTRVLLNGSNIGIDELIINADRLSIPSKNITARGAKIVVNTIRSKNPASGSKSPLSSGDIRVIASHVTYKEITVTAPVINIKTSNGDVLGALGFFESPGVVNTVIKGWIFNRIDSFEGTVDLSKGNSFGFFKVELPYAALKFADSVLNKKLSEYIKFTSPIKLEGHVTINTGWNFNKCDAYIDANNVSILGILVNEMRGNFDFDGKQIKSEDVYARIGRNFARGALLEDIPNRNFRYLIKGQLRPLEISRWIPQAWWTDLFSPFGFPENLPQADLDFFGSMIDGLHAKTFVYVYAPRASIKNVSFNSIETTLFSRPQYVDVLNFSVSKPNAGAKGRFTRSVELSLGNSSQILDFDFSSNLSFDDLETLGGPAAKSGFSAFEFTKAPAINARGKVSGVKSILGAHKTITVDINTDSEFRLNHFPFDGVTATVYVKDNQYVLPHITTSVAGGSLEGSIKLTGEFSALDLAYKGTLINARLDKTIAILSSFSADKLHKKPEGLESFLKERSAVLFSASSEANGTLGKPYSFHGIGNAQFYGSELGQIKMLGLLSEFLRFASLRFTSAHAEYKIDGNKLDFSNVSVLGANSSIIAKGNYTFGSKLLDFKARINPFKESKNLPQQVMDVVLTPVSEVLEVELKGTVSKPTWSFTHSPVSLLRDLSKQNSQPSASSQSLVVPTNTKN